MTGLLVSWLLVSLGIAILRRGRHAKGAGLIGAYVIVFFMTHWVGAAMYAVPEHQYYNPETVILGFQQAVYGIAAFALGCLAAAPIVLDLGVLPKPRRVVTVDETLPVAFLAAGALAFVASMTPLSRIPSATAILSTGQNLAVAGLGLALWRAWQQKNYRMLQLWAGLTLMIPMITLVARGFIGTGAVAAFTVLVFASQLIKNRALVLAAGVLCCYVGLSVFVTYARDRDAIRTVVWGGESFNDRIDKISETVQDFEWFDLANAEHRARIDIRLNQNYFVGLTVARMGELGEHANGATIVDAFIALVPRALWPDKPMTAGSGHMVSDYTGIAFAGDTSVGVGQVLELFINFGTAGVLGGFFVIGLLLTVLDTMAARCLAVNDLHGFVLWYLPGISMLQVGGSLMEVVTGAVASLIVAHTANRVLERIERRKRNQPKMTLRRPNVPAHEGAGN